MVRRRVSAMVNMMPLERKSTEISRPATVLMVFALEYSWVLMLGLPLGKVR